MKKILLDTIIDGKVKTYEVIVTYHDDKTNKDYVVYTDKTYNEEDKLNIFYSLYKVVDGKITLLETSEIKDKKIGLELIKEIGNLYKN